MFVFKYPAVGDVTASAFADRGNRFEFDDAVCLSNRDSLDNDRTLAQPGGRLYDFLPSADSYFSNFRPLPSLLARLLIDTGSALAGPGIGLCAAPSRNTSLPRPLSALLARLLLDTERTLLDPSTMPVNGSLSRDTS